MNNKYSNTLKAFYSIFEIGVPHHSQDVNLSGRYFNYPFPAFLDTDFLELLFKSRFSMLKTGDPRFNPLKRYKLYELNLNVQHILCPEIDKVPFGKKGSYNTREFLRGPLYWSVVKTLRFFTERRKYPPSFVYGPVYKEYLIENIKKINNDKQSDVNSLINTDNALNSLLKTENLSSEKSCHRYSNIIAFYLIEKALANENQSSNIQK